MKKRICFLMLAGALLLTGCGASTDKAGAPERVQMYNAADTEDLLLADEGIGGMELEEKRQRPGAEYGNGAASLDYAATQTTVQANVVRDEIYHDDGQLLYTLQMQSMKVSVPDSPDTEKKVNEYLETYEDNVRLYAAEQGEQARESYGNLEDRSSWYGYSCYIYGGIERLDERVIALTFQQSDYTGGAHPNMHQISYNFSAQDGTLLTLIDLLPEQEARTHVETQLIEALDNMAGDFGLYDGYEENVRRRFMGMGDDSAWYLSESGLVFFFSPDEISPYATGVIRVELPYEDLAAEINPAYLPAKDESTPAVAENLDAEVTFALEDETVERDALSAVQDPMGACVRMRLLVPAYDVRICQAEWIGDQVAARQAFYAATVLQSGDEVLFQVSFSDVFPNICVQYTTLNGERRTVYLFQSGMDGSLLTSQQE